MSIEEDIKQSRFKNLKQKTLINILYTAAALEYKHSSMLKLYGLTPAQYNVLRILRGQHPRPSSVNLLIERMIDKSSNASRIVEKLRTKGLVNREECESDRRLVEVIITNTGLDLLKMLDTREDSFFAQSFNLSDQEAELLNEYLDKLRELLKNNS